MYIAQAFKGQYDWWRYVVGVFVVFFAWQLIGMIPLGVAIGIKAFNGDVIPTTIPEMSQSLGSNLFLFLMLLSFAFGLFGVFFASRVLHQQNLIRLTTSRKKIDWKRFWFIFMLWGIFSSGMVLVDYYLTPQDYQLNFQLKPFLILSVIAILLIPLQTSFEEYFFRGYLMQGLGVFTTHKYFTFVAFYILLSIPMYFFLKGNESFGVLVKIISVIFYIGLFLYLVQSKIIIKITNTSQYNLLYKIFKTNLTPLLITSVSFGLMHIMNPEVEKLGYIIMVYYIGTGLFLGVITLMDEGLELSLGFHAANNLFTALLVTADWTAFQTNSILKDLSDPSEMALTEIFIPVLIVFPILLFILAKKYNWSNWQEKLLGQINVPSSIKKEIDND